MILYRITTKSLEAANSPSEAASAEPPDSTSREPSTRVSSPVGVSRGPDRRKQECRAIRSCVALESSTPYSRRSEQVFGSAAVALAEGLSHP